MRRATLLPLLLGGMFSHPAMHTPAATRPPLPAPAEIAKLPPDGGTNFNRLIHSRSPYLLQHARNPVDWYPWSAEAFEKARRENKPVFLSIGYSSCHWCHVMEHESFEHDDVAALLNERYVCIKVDREERPDLDDLYMTATQLMTGRGGWPNAVWLLPDGRPWYAGTYFPREDRGPMPGFITMLHRLADVWSNRPGDIAKQADQLADAIRENAQTTAAGGYAGPLTGLVDRAVSALSTTYDTRNGGFGDAPKFPPHSSLRLLLDRAQHGDVQSRRLLTGTLDAMQRGGIHDHVGGGFHRYATDERWFLPHFEKMLYDNGQLAAVYALAFAATSNTSYRETATALCDWLLRDMTDPTGGFHSALDADSEGEEGRFYVWSHAEIERVLGPDDAALFCTTYGIEKNGNFHDEATGRATGLNIPYLNADLPVADAGRLRTCREKLRTVRAKRVWPFRDDKILTGWNGLAISGLALAGHHLQEPRFTAAAEKAAQFALAKLRAEDGRLLRSYRAGKAAGTAFLDDYACLAEGLLDLADATGNSKYRTEAVALTRRMLADFSDPVHGGFFTTPEQHEALLVRQKDAFDQAAPSGNGVAIRVLLRLAGEDEAFRDFALQTLRSYGELMRRAPGGCGSLLHALALAERSGPLEDAATAAAGPVRITLKIDKTEGTNVSGRVLLAIAAPFHVNANPADEGLIPTTLAAKSSRDWKIVQAEFPTIGNTRHYTGRVEIPFRAERTGDGPLELDVTVQPCDESRCLAPVTLTVRAK